eukprot:gene51414-44174_t
MASNDPQKSIRYIAVYQGDRSSHQKMAQALCMKGNVWTRICFKMLVEAEAKFRAALGPPRAASVSERQIRDERNKGGRSRRSNSTKLLEFHNNPANDKLLSAQKVVEETKGKLEEMMQKTDDLQNDASRFHKKARVPQVEEGDPSPSVRPCEGPAEPLALCATRARPIELLSREMGFAVEWVPIRDAGDGDGALRPTDGDGDGGSALPPEAAGFFDCAAPPRCAGGPCVPLRGGGGTSGCAFDVPPPTHLCVWEVMVGVTLVAAS